MPVVIVGHILIPFFSIRDGANGAGLGLPVAPDVARRLGGDLSLDTECDKNDESVLTLPIAGATPHEKDSVAQVAQRLRPTAPPHATSSLLPEYQVGKDRKGESAGYSLDDDQRDPSPWRGRNTPERLAHSGNRLSYKGDSRLLQFPQRDLLLAFVSFGRRQGNQRRSRRRRRDCG